MTAVLSTSLKGAVALTTGGGGQIGRAICAALSAAAARVIATDLSASVPSGLNVDDWMQHDVTSA